MGALAGFIFGYVLGMKQGPEGYARLKKALEEVLGSPETKTILEKLPSLMNFNLAGGAHGKMAYGSTSTTGAVGTVGEGRLEIGPAELVSMVRHFAESDAIQSIVSGGMDFARGIFDRFALGARAER